MMAEAGDRSEKSKTETEHFPEGVSPEQMPSDGQASQRVPVTLLTGFLGAGKTARLNATLDAAAREGEAKIAVIENELGALGVDGALVANRHDDGIIELSNGCLCCSAEVDLVDALESLARRRDTRPFGRVIIETTGLADVGPVVALLRDPHDPLYQDYDFEGVVTVVDAAAFKHWAGILLNKFQAMDESDTQPFGSFLTSWRSGFGGSTLAESSGLDELRSQTDIGLGRAGALFVYWKQVALADQVVVSKADVVDEESVAKLCKAVELVCPLARVTVDHGKVVAPLPFASSGGDSKRQRMSVPRVGVPSRFCGTKRQRRSTGVHLEGIDSITVSFPSDTATFNAENVRTLATALLAGTLDGYGEAWRIKGIILVEDSGLMLIQGVGDQVSLEVWPHGLDSDPFIVIIGEYLNRDRLEAALVECQSVSAPHQQLGSASG